MSAAMLVAITMVGSSACAPVQTSGPTRTAYVEIPAVPLPRLTAIEISAAALDAVACEACSAGQAPDEARFFSGDLPLQSIDAILAGKWGDGSAALPTSALGNLFVSGYFGGIYLRGELASVGAGRPAPDQTPIAGALASLGGGALASIDEIAAGLTRVARSGTDDEVRTAAGAWAVVLAAIQGYNRGYLEVAVANPPPGVAVDPARLDCLSFFDCRSDVLPLAALDGLDAQRRALAAPPDAVWAAWADVVNGIGAASVSGGSGVWTTLLSHAGFNESSYDAIIDLSVGFLEVTQAAMLTDLAAVAGGDAEVGRRGLMATAGLVVWAGSYFAGLASPLVDGTRPLLRCDGGAVVSTR